MRIFFYILILVCLCTTADAQEILAPQPKAKLLTYFPFRQFSGGVMILKAKLNNIPDSLTFILDTGSGGISLDSATCSEFNINLTPTDTTIKGIGGVHKVSFAFNQQLHLPGLDIDKLNFHVNDYAVLSSVYGEKIDGIIGYSFFSRYIVKINSDSFMIAVYSPGEINYPKRGLLLRPAFTSLPIVPIRFRDARKMDFNFYFDTGAGLNFLLSEDFVKDSSLLLSRRKPVVTQAEGMGGRLQMRLTVIKRVHIGQYTFRAVPVFLYNDDYNVLSYPHIGGLLGNDLLRRFNLVVNYPQREIHLLPNTHFKDSFDYAYTGMAIYYNDGHITIEDIIPGSPADKAGLKVGDVVIGVANSLSNSIQQYKSLLQSVNEKIKVLVDRNGELYELFIKPKSILR